MSLWSADNIRDVAEAVGISHLDDEVTENLARDVEYRISQVLEEALKFMRHAKRATMTTQDVAQALRLLDVEPLYGYETTRPLRFGEATLGPGRPLFYVEDEEVDFEKLINAPLPRIPREISFTAHWLAIEGVQPSIPQNPSSSSASAAAAADAMPKGAAAGGAAAGVGGGGGGASAGLGGTGGGGGNLAAVSGRDGVAVKPLVKHVLSKELQLYFEKVCAAVLDETNDAYRTSALASLREDPGLHQLVPYFVQFISEKVTHGLKDLFVLTQTIHMTESLIENKSLYIDPYIPSLVPPVLTCLIGSRLGSATPPSSAHEHFALRDLAASLIGRIAKKYAHSSHTLRPRLARTLLRCFLDPGKPLSTHYGAVIGLRAIADGPDVVRELVVPNLSTYDLLLREAIAAGEEEGGAKKVEAEKVADTLLAVLLTLKDDALSPSPPRQAGGGDDGMAEDMPAEMQSRLIAKLGEVVGSRVIAREDVRLAQILLDDKAI